ncbi:YHYH domain-containing protein [Teichococcus deserti]|uniref:YHYH domain-containing protein n=1 Tax=Teichococcus deserti TaxID=1817963 RepID=UPI003462D445
MKRSTLLPKPVGRRVLTLAIAGVVAAFSQAGRAEAHGGRTDRNGCHKERATGRRHCH